MKILYISILYILLFSLKGYAQFGPQILVSVEADGARDVITADIDGDGDLDVISASSFDNKIAWYENLDEFGNFGPQRIITLGMPSTNSVFAADIDGDGDIDVVANSGATDKISWFENTDGLGNFGLQNIISNTADGAFSVIAADIDNNGDMDVVSASSFSGIVWQKNINGIGNLWSEQLITNSTGTTRSVSALDMDNDGDLDILANGLMPTSVYWVENMDGLGDYGTIHIISGTGSYRNSVIATDIDGDGDKDVVTASPGDNELAWYENLDGIGNFGNKNTISNTLESSWDVFAADLDNDGDIDVLSTMVETFSGEVVWYENLDGIGNFGGKNIITSDVEFPRSVYAADLDNDGDMDVLSASQNDNKIAWYENLTILGTPTFGLDTIKIYPNPAQNKVYIDAPQHNITQVTVYNLLGKQIAHVQDNLMEIDLSKMASGLYVLKIETTNGTISKKIVKE